MGGILAKSIAEEAAATIPQVLARAIPADISSSTLALPTQEFAYATVPDAIEGMTGQELYQALELPGPPSLSGYNVLTFPTPEEGLATPLSANPDVPNGFTSGFAPEYIVPNGPIPAGTTTTYVPW